MSKRKSYNFIVELGVYPLDVMFSFNQADKELLKSVDGFIDIGMYRADLADLVNWTEVHRGMTLMLPCNQSIIKLKCLPNTPHYRGVLSHEIFQVVFLIMDRVGMKPSFDSWEAYAYAIQYLTEKVYENLI